MASADVRRLREEIDHLENLAWQAAVERFKAFCPGRWHHGTPARMCHRIRFAHLYAEELDKRRGQLDDARRRLTKLENPAESQP